MPKVTEILRDQLITDILSHAVGLRLDVKVCRMCNGKWTQNTIKLLNLSEKELICEVSESNKHHLERLQINQPVGISLHLEHNKYIFDTTVTAINMEGPVGTLRLDIPEQLEKMPRRAYERQPVPADIHVNVLFWHRGYADMSLPTPKENYWQGRLTNLSAGGAQVAIELAQQENFQKNQLIGLQFTPMYYQKPVLVEGQVIHIQPSASESILYLGIEFLGLEVTTEGRDTLHRLMDIVEEYAKQNHGKTI